jgi:phospholipase/carboxylesterase
MTRQPSGRAPVGTGPDNPHSATTGLRLGAPIGEADAAVILVHGRGGSPEGMAEFERMLARPGTAWIAPRARAGTWYPQSFLAPLEANQPWLDSALDKLARLMEQLGQEEGLGTDRIVLLGFSQGACLATEFMARSATRWGGLAALSGGLIGPPGSLRSYEGSLRGTPAFFGCGHPDPHIPKERVEESGRVYSELGADVEVRIYPGLGHAVNDDEVEQVRRMLQAL